MNKISWFVASLLLLGGVAMGSIATFEYCAGEIHKLATDHAASEARWLDQSKRGNDILADAMNKEADCFVKLGTLASERTLIVIPGPQPKTTLGAIAKGILNVDGGPGRILISIPYRVDPMAAGDLAGVVYTHMTSNGALDGWRPPIQSVIAP